MKARIVLLLGLSLVGCKKDKKAPPGAASGSAASGSAVAAPPRPSQQPLPVLPALDLPEDPKRKEKIELGHVLFFDKRLSGSNDRACYSCHQNEDGTGGHDPLAIGSGDKQLTRHAPMLWNVGYWKNAFYWDGRTKTLEANVNGAWGGGNMGGAPAGADAAAMTAALDKRAAGLAKIKGYKPLFEAAYGKTEIKAEHVNSAIAEYMRTFICNETAYDKFAAGQKDALSEQQQRGLDIFLGKGKCITCHAPPFFSTAQATDGGAYFNMGIGTKDVPEDQVDIGRMKVSNQPTDWAAFKPPSLRNITKTPPYFHNGSAAKLEDAVHIMAGGGIPNKNKTPLAEDTHLTDAEFADLIAFLGGLECPGQLEEPKVP